MNVESGGCLGTTEKAKPDPEGTVVRHIGVYRNSDVLEMRI